VYKRNDLKGKKIMKGIENVPKEIKEACLMEYVKRCQRLHTVAFMEWRQMFPNTLTGVTNQKMLQHLIESKN
tara:strand:- start:243 stop:458 length:216 start_codon:yes stop_codon:yes gene_type:complete